jgi:hypothetical protein
MKSRRRIAFPKAQDHAIRIDDYSRDLGPAKWGSLSRRMSALGQKQTLQSVRLMSALPPKADIGTQSRNVRFVPKADITQRMDVGFDEHAALVRPATILIAVQ